MELVRKRLSASEIIPPNIRYHGGTNQVQFSPDNGVTWFDTPSADPRHSDVFRYPALETDDPRCDAAANMTKWLRDFLDQATEILCAGSTALSVANAAIPLYELISGGSLTLLALVAEVAGTLFGIGCTALTAAFDDDVYDQIECIFYCQMGLDGQVSALQLGLMETKITSGLTTTAALITNAILALQGEVGLSNAGVIGGQTGDCSDCVCGWCYKLDFAVTDGGIVPIGYVSLPVSPLTFPVYEAGRWRSSTQTTSGGLFNQISGIQVVFPAPCEVTYIYVEYEREQIASGGFSVMKLNGGNYDGTTLAVLADIVGVFASDYSGLLINPTSVEFYIDTAAELETDLHNSFISITFYGNGDNPFGVDNC